MDCKTDEMEEVEAGSELKHGFARFPSPPGKPLQVEAEDGGYGVVTCHDMYGDEEAFEEDLGMCIYR